MVFGARQSFQFFRQNTWFPENNRALTKFFHRILHYVISITKVERRLGQKYKVSFKIDDDTVWETINCSTHIAQQSRSKGKQAMKFCQLIEYSMRYIFLEKSYTKCCGETITRPFSKKSKLSVSLDQQFKILQSLFLLYDKLRAIEIY